MKITDTEPMLRTDNTKVWQTEIPDINPFMVGNWIVWAPWAHPVWPYHWFSLVHLREIEGHENPTILVENATHQLVIFALHPDHVPEMGDLRTLEPVSVMQQFVAKDDAAALQAIEKCLRQVATGRVTPDSDGRKLWKHLLVEGCPDL